jgi:two-component system cell cycle sensor histidine kinase/response regulator CckA
VDTLADKRRHFRRDADRSLHEREQHYRTQAEELAQTASQRTEELQAKEAQLEQSQKLEAIGRLAGGVAHDFNNLITGIVGIAEDLQQSLPEGHPHRAELSQIIQASNRASNLTRQLLAFGRRQLAQPKIIDPNQIIGDLQRMLERLLREDIELVTHLDPQAGYLHMDPAQMEQILVNLLLNARDAMPGGGTIVIETAHAEISPEYTRRQFQIGPGAYVKISVRDTGVGMSPEILPHIFEPFFTTKKPGEGTGLGLATVYGVVKQNGGDIAVESEPGKGSRFTIYLPRTRDHMEQRAIAREATPRGSETILLVEDEAIVRRVASRALRRVGYEVLEAESGVQALADYGQYPQKIDLLVTDIVMPGMNGRDLARQFLPRHPGTAVLFISGYADQLVNRPGELSASEFLEKSFTSEMLCRKVREVLDRARALRGESPATTGPGTSQTNG